MLIVTEHTSKSPQDLDELSSCLPHEEGAFARWAAVTNRPQNTSPSCDTSSHLSHVVVQRSITWAPLPASHRPPCWVPRGLPQPRVKGKGKGKFSPVLLMGQPRNCRHHFFTHILLADPSHMVRLTAKETGKCSLELESHIQGTIGKLCTT